MERRYPAVLGQISTEHRAPLAEVQRRLAAPRDGCAWEDAAPVLRLQLPRHDARQSLAWLAPQLPFRGQT